MRIANPFQKDRLPAGRRRGERMNNQIHFRLRALGWSLVAALAAAWLAFSLAKSRETGNSADHLPASSLAAPVEPCYCDSQSAPSRAPAAKVRQPEVRA